MNRFQDVPKLDRATIDMAFSSDDSEKICEALVSIVFHDSDLVWIQERCIDFLEHSDIQVSGLAATCLGHIARIHRRLNKDRVVELLQEKAIRTPEISGRIEDALDDINMFVS